MNEEKKSKIFFAIDLIFYFLILCWLFLPVLIPGQFIKIELIKITYGFDSFVKITGISNIILFYLSFLLFLIPLVFIYKIVSYFLRDKNPVFFSSNHYFSFIINIIFSGLIIFFIILIILKKALNIGYFTSLDIFTGVIILLSVIYSFIQPVNIINKLRNLNKSYRLYLEFSQTAAVKEHRKLQERLSRIGILEKLLIAFVIAIVVIILSLSSLLMGEFKKTIVESVIATGTMLADQSVSFIKENLEEDKSFLVDTYLKKELKKNETSSLAFDSISWYKKDPLSGNYFIKLSTDISLLGKELKTELDNIEEPEYRYNKNTKTYDIIAPIIESKKKIGFSIVQYKQDEIFKSYNQTQVRIFLFAVLIVYLALILIYIIGSNIVLPILFLQMNVRKIGATLAGMIKGTTKIQASSLQYDDMINSNDEIKTLSREINNMVTVIKGIIPYISASTLMHSDREGKTSTIKDLTFLFTDIRGFTTLCEGKTPEEVVNILNHYLDLQTQIILDNGGDIDKFVGDELMAVFDGPEKELNACKAGLEIRNAMEEERKKREALKEPTVEIGIGINSGTAVFGTSARRERMDFTCIGDNVNIAARLEGANKEYQSKSLITESVYKKVKDFYLCREIDFMTVKGKKEPIKIFDIMHEKGKASKAITDIKEIYEKGLKLYREKKWDEALAVFKENIEKFSDGPSEAFYNRCLLFKNNPPPDDWDGVFRLTVK